MSLSSISSQLPRTVEQNRNMEYNLRAGASYDGFTTLAKVTAVFAAVIITGLVYTLAGPLAGIFTVVVCAIQLTRIFRNNLPYDQGTYYMHRQPAPDPHHHHGPGPYVPGHVQVGAGHFPPGRGQPGGHVPVGRGHMPGAPGGHPGHAHPPIHGHVGVGRGHDHGPTRPGPGVPPPSGPGGHVPVGRR